MKKEYISPEIKVFMTKCRTTLLAGSAIEEKLMTDEIDDTDVLFKQW